MDNFYESLARHITQILVSRGELPHIVGRQSYTKLEALYDAPPLIVGQPIETHIVTRSKFTAFIYMNP